MNEKEFKKKIYYALNTYDINLRFFSSWYGEVVNSLKSIKLKVAEIKHPRHLGDALEDELKVVLTRLLPQRYQIDKGFLLNYFSALSQEQDLLVIDTSLGSPIFKTDKVGYYPVESAIGAIEVKSNLNLSELRKSFVSCIRSKKLFFPAFDYLDALDKRFFYTIFAYTTSLKQISFERELKASIKLIPEPLRPNLIYILDRGLYLPTNSGKIILNLESIQKTEEGYVLIPNTPDTDDEWMNLFLFFSMFIEHAFQQTSIRKPTKYSSYAITPSRWRKEIKEVLNSKGPVNKIFNKYTRWSDENWNQGLVTLEERCNNCGIKYEFYVLPPGIKSFRLTLESDLKSRGCVPLPKSKKFKCPCGKMLEIKEAEGTVLITRPNDIPTKRKK